MVFLGKTKGLTSECATWNDVWGRGVDLRSCFTNYSLLSLFVGNPGNLILIVFARRKTHVGRANELSIVFSVVVWMMFFLFAFAACSGSGKRPPTRTKAYSHNRSQKPLVPMEPIQIVGLDDERKGGVFTSTGLFEKGLVAFRKRKFDDAIGFFEQLLKYFPESRNVPPAIFNIGVCHERRSRYEDAAVFYKQYLKQRISDEDKAKTLFRLAQISFKRQNYRDVVEVLKAPIKFLEPEKQLEADILKGKSLLKMGRINQANKVFVSASRLYDLYKQGEVSLENSLGARLSFYVAEIPQKKMNRIKLETTPAARGRGFAQKAKFFKEAKAGYFKVLEHGDSAWTSLALKAVITLLEDFVWSVIRAPIPHFQAVRFFDKESSEWRVLSADKLRDTYLENLKKKLRLVILRAIESYKRNENLTKGLGLGEFWKEDAQKLLARLRRLVDVLPSLQFGAKEKKQTQHQKKRELFTWGVDSAKIKTFHPFTVPLK